MRAPSGRAEVPPRRQRHVRLLQGPLAEGPRVQARARDVEVGVEGAVGLHRHRQADALQAVQDEPAAGEQLQTPVLAGRQRFGREAGQRRHLRGGRGAQEEVDGQVVGWLEQLLGQDEPAQAPPGHPEVLREGGHDNGLGVGLQGGAGRRAVRGRIGQGQVDLVDDPPGPALARRLADGGQFGEGDGRAGRVRRRGHLHRARAFRPGCQRRGEVELIAGGRSRGGQDDAAPEGVDELAVAGVAGVGHDDVVARLRRQCRGQQQPRRGPRRDEHPPRVDVDAVAGAVQAGHGPAQRGQARGRGVGQGAPVHGGAHGLVDPRRGAEGGLAEAELGDADPPGLQLPCPGADAHGVEGLCSYGSLRDLHGCSWGRGACHQAPRCQGRTQPAPVGGRPGAGGRAYRRRRPDPGRCAEGRMIRSR